MTSRTRSLPPLVRLLTLCLFALLLLMDIGCVSQRAYEQIRAETREHTQALAVIQEDVKGLDQLIAELQAANRHEDAVTGELRATIQREEEQLPVMRQEAEERLSSLKTQVASLLDQSWHLARKISDIRSDSASLKAMAAEYKQEVELAQTHASALVVSHPASPPIANRDLTDEEEPLPPAMLPAEEKGPPQVVQAVSPTSDPILNTPTSPAAPPPATTVEPPTVADESWIDMIAGWLLAFWNWLLS
ncbi:MAG: hypothetical protein AB7P24_18055 [Nitrospira sp.]